MRGYGLFFIAACMALVAASAGVILYFTAGMAALEASVIALAILFALMVLEVSAGRRRDRAEFSARFEALSRASVDIARQVAELRHNVAAIAANPMRPAPAPAPDPKHKSKPAGEPADHDIGDLAQVVEDLAQTVAVHEALLAARAEMMPPEPVAVEIESADFAPVEPSSPEPADAAETTAPFQAGSTDVTSDGARIGLVREAVAAGRIDLYLQPVVTLPQRKVRYYEALSRMRLAGGEVIGAADFLPAAKAAGLLPRIDERLVHNCVQVVRRLAAKNRDIGLFLNIAPETLTDAAVFPEILGYLDANRALAPSLIFEVPHAVYRGFGAAEHNGLSQLSERGFRFSLDRIEDFRIDPRGLADRGVRFVKVPADRLLTNAAEGGASIASADLADFLARHGIELVADHIESETIVVDLLDFEVPYGQGFLFAPPRPVRADVLSGERAGNAGVESTAPPAAAPPESPEAAVSGLRQIARTLRQV